MTCINNKRPRAKPPSVNFPKQRTQLGQCITPVIMVPQNCMQNICQIKLLFFFFLKKKE